MRQHPIRREATVLRFVCTALFVLGIALVDLSVVWVQGSFSPPLSAAVGLAQRASGCDAEQGGFVPFAPTPDRDCATSRSALSSCFTSDCRPGASLMATSRPHAAMSRLAGRIGADLLQSADPHLHRVTLLAQVKIWSPADQEPLFSSAPMRPARLAGADRSIPRPPPAPPV